MNTNSYLRDIDTVSFTSEGVRPESNMLKILPKLLSGISQNFHLLCPSVLPLCLYYALRLATFLLLSWNILINECSIRVFHYKVTVLLESVELRSYVQCI